MESYRLIDWVLELPLESEQEFSTEFIRYDQENIMPYVTSIERLAREEGLGEGIEASRQAFREVLTDTVLAKIGSVPAMLQERLRMETSLEKLQALQRRVSVSTALEDLKTELTTPPLLQGPFGAPRRLSCQREAA